MVRYLALELSYDVNNIIGLPYDWRYIFLSVLTHFALLYIILYFIIYISLYSYRLSPIEMEKRDSLFTHIKYKLYKQQINKKSNKIY